MSIVASLHMGNILFADHQIYSPGQFQIWRNGDPLLINANAPAPGGGNNQYAQRKSPWANSVNISCVRKIGVGDGVNATFPLPADLSFVPKLWKFWSFDKGLWSDSALTGWQVAGGSCIFPAPVAVGMEIYADISEGLQSYPESMSSNYGTPGVADLAYNVTPDYVYKAGDFKCAYQQQQGNGNVCVELTRQMVYLRPNIWVLYDRVTTTRPDYIKQVRWHLLANAAAGIFDDDFSVGVGKSALSGCTFSADPLTTMLETVLNSGQDGPKPVRRISVSLAAPSIKARFLTVFQELDLTTIPEVPHYETLPNEDWVGIKGSILKFAREGPVSFTL